MQSNFTAGEISPRLNGRVDLKKYGNACSCLHNYLVFAQGGVTRRPGTRHVSEVKTSSAGKVRLQRFEPTATSAYVLEFGDGYVRFYKNGAQVTSGGSAVEVTTPYAIADVFALDFVPSIDVLYILHPNYQTRKLERYSDTTWKLRTVSFSPPPSIEFGARPTADIQPSAVSGDGVTLTAFNADAFLAADVGREVLVLDGPNAGARAGIAAVGGAKSITVNVCVAFTNTNVVCNKLWKITVSPKTGVTPTASTPEGKSITLTADANAWRRGVSDADSDCGKFVHLNSGVVEITAVSSATAATGTIRGDLSGTTKAESGNWTLDEALFSACNGWAEHGGFHDSRLYVGAKHRFAGSKVNDYENMALGNLDDDGVLFPLDSDVLQTIAWLRGGKSLLIGTLSGEFEAIGSTDAPITASNIQVKEQARHGSCTSAAPVKIGDAMIFVTRSGRQVRELLKSFDDTLEGGFKAADLLLLAEHLTRRSTPTGTDPAIVQLAYQKEPDGRVWAVRSDGVLLCLTYLREHDVIAWARCTTQGNFESVAVIPHPSGDRDQVWVSVQRTVNGATVRYIEYLDDAGLSYPTLNTDAAYVCNSATALLTFAGIGHLECATVQIVADGAVRPATTVVGGNITISSPCAKKVEVGLGYTSDLVTMPPEVPIEGGTSQMTKRRYARLSVRLLDSLGVQMGTTSCQALETIPFRSSSDCMGMAPALFTGDKEISHLGWDDGRVFVRQPQPLPSTVLAIMGVLDQGGS